MKHNQSAAKVGHRRFIYPSYIKEFILVSLLALGSAGVLAGCKDTSTTSTTENSPTATASPSATSSTTVENSPATSTSSSTTTTTTVENSPATSTDSSPPTITTPQASPTASTFPSQSKATNAAQMAKAEETLKTFYTQQLGVPIDSVKCPSQVSFKPGSTFECQGTAQGVKFGISVNMKNEQGGFTTNSKGLLSLSKLEDLLKQTIKEKAGLDVTADCGGKIRVAKPGESFTCDIKNDKGQARKATITVKDEKGNISIKI